MRITYLLDFNPYEPSGVISKIADQTNYWKSKGHDIQIVFICPVDSKEKLLLPNAQVFSSDFISKSNLGLFKIQLNKIFQINKAKKSIRQFKPDVIYLRQGSYYPGLAQILNICPSIVELNTDDTIESKSEHWIRRLGWQYGRYISRKYIKGMIAVTNELSNRFAISGVPVLTVGNSINLSDFDGGKKLSEFTDNNIVFVGSPGLKWHGIDKILRLAENLTNYTFHIVGEKQVSDNLSNVKWHGYLEKPKLSTLYDQMSIGIGTLALHRKGMNEATPLKVREYLAHGLPTIIGYQDTDLHEENYILNIGNFEENVDQNIDKIKGFIDKWKNKRVERDKVFSKLDVSVKETERLNFFQKVVDQNK